MKIYVNGVVEKDDLVSVVSAQSGDVVKIGTSNSNSDLSLNGIVDEVGFWSRELTPTEVTSLYNSGAGTRPPPPPPPSTAPTSGATKTINVWLLSYQPAGAFSNVVGDNPAAFTQNTLLPAMNDGSKYHGYSNPSAQPALNYVLSSTNIHVENNPPPLVSGSTAYDYTALFTRYDLCNFAKANDIKAVILWADGSGPYAGGFWESAITGSNGYPTNGANLNTCPGKTVVVYGLNYTRGLDSALHSYGHHLERTFMFTRPEYFNWSGSTNDGNWYRLPPYPASSHANACGTDHDPTNARQEYDYVNTATFQSDCQNWKPDRSGAQETLSCSTWNCDEAQYHKWLMQNMPGLGTTLSRTTGERVPNWWVYVGDPDNCLSNALACSGL